jgi:RHS repeat-associated protein
MEAGERWMLNDVAGYPIRTWDSRLFLRRMTYDELRRPTGLYVTENGAERLAERTVYGESQGDAANHRTRVYQVYDGAGVVTNVSYDFKGNLQENQRRLLPNYKQAVNWDQNPTANDGTFTTHTTFDALNRPLIVTTPDGSVYRPTFNEANLLDKVGVNLRGDVEATPFITNIDYNAKGQRGLIAYSHGTQTTYTYDPLTFRLTHLKTTRPANPDATASQLFQNATVVQDLHYTYDPVGNITRIEDAAPKIVFHNGQQVDPVGDYTYDAIYRLIGAKGREHIGQTAHDFNPPDGNRRDYPFVGHRDPNDLQALRNYTERYEYDEVGNFQFMRHLANGGSWTRRYDYEEASLIETAKMSNRLTRTTVGNGVNFVETYTYTDDQANDVHGCMTAINNMKMAWNFEDQLQQVNLGGGGAAYYVYDAGGQRVRKVVETHTGMRHSERIYLGGFEVYREFNGNGVPVMLERESLHVMDGQQRIALVETKTIENGNPINAPMPIQRYQLGNHLGSATVALDDNGALVSYEEYHLYGTTAFQAGRSAAEVSLKRYRYTGKERDEESGLYYHGTRYYALWLGRWASCEPKGLVDGSNLYCYVRCNPLVYLDDTGNESQMSYAAGLLQRSLEVKRTKDAAMHQHLENAKIARESGSPVTAAQEQRAALSELRTSIHESMEFGTKALTATSTLMLGPIGVGYIGPGAVSVVLASPGKVMAAGSFLVGLLDPHPPGASPLDIPGPLDDAGRATKAALREGAEKLTQQVEKKVVQEVEKVAQQVEKKVVDAVEKEVVDTVEKTIVDTVKKEVTLESAETVAKEAAEKAKGVVFTRSQLQHAFDRHAGDFGVSGNKNNKTLDVFESIIEKHVAAPGTRAIAGEYRGLKGVTHFLDPSTRLNVIRDASGNFLSGWKLSAQQLHHVLTTGKLGGGK